MKPPMLTNSDGNKSASFTMLVVAFGVVTLWLLASIVEQLGPVHIRAFASTEAMAYFMPVATLYFGRKQQEMLLAGKNPGEATTTTGSVAEKPEEK